MSIDYDSDLVKHFIRTDGWLPICRRRLKSIRDDRPRRMRYFTFCAVGAVDVLMLDVAKIVVQSPSKRFDTVAFFGRNEASIVETERRIPGAIGFAGNFVDVVLHDDPDESLIADGADPLDSPEAESDSAGTRKEQRIRALKRQFIREFPFDVVNLDLEEFIFRPKEELPGKIVNALRKVFAWQQRPLDRGNGHPVAPINEFSLIFTTQIGPPNITNDCMAMLESYLAKNLQDDERLSPILIQRSGLDDLTQLKHQQFDLFFKIAMPKVIAQILLEQDWYIDPDAGITTYEYERPSKDGPYRMLNFVMDVRRQDPPKNKRPPSGGDSRTPEAIAAYRDVTHRLFRDKEKVVVESELDAEELKNSLARIVSRRKKYCPDDGE